MKTYQMFALSLACLATLSAAPKIDVIGGTLSDEEMQLIRQSRENAPRQGGVDIFVLAAAGKSALTPIPLFHIENVKENLNKDLTFENPELQILITARLSEDERQDTMIKYTLHSGTRYLELRKRTAEAQSQNHLLSAQTEANLLLLNKTPTILYRYSHSSTSVPFDASKPTATDRELFTVIAMKD